MTAKKSARQHARERGALDGADAQALEGALAMTERERDEAQTELAATKLRVSDLKHALGTDAQGWFDRFKQAQKEGEIFKTRLDDAEAELARMRDERSKP